MTKSSEYPTTINTASPDEGTHAAALMHLQRTLRRAFHLLIIEGDSHTELQELPLMQLKCIHKVFEEDQLRVLDLAQRLNSSLPSVSRLVERLVKSGFLLRKIDDKDRRAVRLSLTLKARMLLEARQVVRNARFARLVGALPTDNVAQISNSLESLIDLAERNRPAVVPNAD